MSKVLFLVNHDVVIYNFRLELVERLIADGHDVVISSPYGKRIDDLKFLGCEYFEVKFDRHSMNPVSELKILLYYKNLLKKVKPDIVFSYTIKPNIYGSMACRSLGIPCVTNITGLGTAVENGGFSQKLTVALYKMAFKKVQTVFFQNEENMNFFKKSKIKAKRFDLLPGSGVNLERFAPIEYPEQNDIEFAFISRIMKEKGIEQYIEAAKIIKSKYPNVKFHVCGFCEDEYEEKLNELSQNGIIVYHGMVRNVKEVLSHIHCTVHPTYYPEGISNVLLESCACARPIITTNRAGCREVIDDGINGFVVNQKDSADLAKKLEKFILLSYEEKKAMGLAGRKKIEQQFDRQIVVEKYIEEMKRAGL